MLYNYADTAFASPALPPLPSPVEGVLLLWRTMLLFYRSALAGRAVRVSDLGGGDLGLHARALGLLGLGAVVLVDASVVLLLHLMTLCEVPCHTTCRDSRVIRTRRMCDIRAI